MQDAARTSSSRGVAVPPVLIPIVAGAAVALTLGVYGRVHDPTGRRPYSLFFTDTIHLKVWFATAAVALAVLQLLTAARLYGKISFPFRTVPSWLGDFHRLTGTLAFAFSLPVAYHCLWSLGFESHADHTRRFLHSLLGCLFYGAFAAKVISVRSRRLPDRMLPIVGGVVFTALVAIWFTSSFWFFRHFPVRF